MNLTRRYFLKSTGALAAYLGVNPQGALGALGARPIPVRTTPGKTLVVIFLRGGADGLNLVVPYADANYNSLRRSIAVPRPGAANGAIELDDTFALHPHLAPMKPMFDNGTMIAAHAVGYAHNTRSHFEEQDVWETGIVGNTINSDGWVNRHLATSEGNGPIRAVAIGDALPRMLHGKAPAYAIRGVSDLTMPAQNDESRARLAAALEHAYCSEPSAERAAAQDLLAQTADTTLEGIEALKHLAGEEYRPSVQYPNNDFARRLSQVARLIKADVGLEVAEVDLGGWDTHNNQGGVNGQFGNLSQTLASGMSAFMRDLEAQLDDVLVVTMTDFGRTAAENGTGGTDHGWANCMFLAGGPVRRAASPHPVVCKWPGLAPDQLHEGRDLLHTTDFRDVLAEVVRVHLGNPHLETVLPQHEFKQLGLVS